VSIIKAADDIERAFKQGHRYSTPLFILIIDATPKQRDQNGRVAFAAGKKLGNAVLRNRCKRVMREATRRCGGPWPGHDVILVAKKSVATASPDRIDEQLLKTIDRAFSRERRSARKENRVMRSDRINSKSKER
jgi:ribonuclease P protein component